MTFTDLLNLTGDEIKVLKRGELERNELNRERLETEGFNGGLFFVLAERKKPFDSQIHRFHLQLHC